MDLAESRSERRESPRLALRLNVEFVAEDERPRSHRMGTTTNVSAGGLYFTSDEWQGIKVGQELGIRLSGLSGYGAGPLFRGLRAKVTVLRLDTPQQLGISPTKAGIAARFTERPCFEVYHWFE